jgi:hypothetical protein
LLERDECVAPSLQVLRGVSSLDLGQEHLVIGLLVDRFSSWGVRVAADRSKALDLLEVARGRVGALLSGLRETSRASHREVGITLMSARDACSHLERHLDGMARLKEFDQ